METVLDSHALITYLEGEPAAPMVRQRFARADRERQPCLMSLMNWGEVLYIIIRRKGDRLAATIESAIDELPLTLIEADRALTRQAAVFKARGGLSYADCFAAALAKQRNAELLTGDPEFRKLSTEIRIQWLAS